MSSNERNFNSYIFDDEDNNEFYDDSTLNNVITELESTDDNVLDNEKKVNTGNIFFTDIKPLNDDNFDSTSSIFGDIELTNIISNIQSDENNINYSDDTYDNTNSSEETKINFDNKSEEIINNDNNLNIATNLFSNDVNFNNIDTNGFNIEDYTMSNNNISTDFISNEVNTEKYNVIDTNNDDTLTNINFYDNLNNTITNIDVNNLEYNDYDVETNSTTDNFDNAEKYTTSNNNISTDVTINEVNTEKYNVIDNSNNDTLIDVNNYDNISNLITNIDVSNLEYNNTNLEANSSSDYNDNVEKYTVSNNNNINTDETINEVNIDKDNVIDNYSDNLDDIDSENKIDIVRNEDKIFETADDNNLLASYIGKNYNKIFSRPFNFSAFFFTSFYLFYRKLYLYGILLFILNLLASFFLNNIIISIGFGLICGFLFNIIYLNVARRRILNIKSKNSDKDINQINNICISKGGTSIGNIFIGLITEIGITIIAIIIMCLTGLLPSIDNLISYISNRTDSFIKNNDYNGIIMYDTSIKIKDKFYISIPSNFENNSDTYEYNYNYKSNEGTFNSCRVSLSVPEGYSSSSKLIKSMAKYYTGDSDSVKEETTNDLVWHWFSYNGIFGKTFYYATTLDKKVYLFEYTIEEDSPSDCDIYRLQIFKSIIKK